MNRSTVIQAVMDMAKEAIIRAICSKTQGIVACVFVDKQGSIFSCQLAKGSLLPGEQDGSLLRCIEYPTKLTSPLEFCTQEEIMGLLASETEKTSEWINQFCDKDLLRSLFPLAWREAEAKKAEKIADVFLGANLNSEKILAFLS